MFNQSGSDWSPRSIHIFTLLIIGAVWVYKYQEEEFDENDAPAFGIQRVSPDEFKRETNDYTKE